MEYIPEIIDSFGRNVAIAILFVVAILGMCFMLSNVSNNAFVILTNKNSRKFFQNLWKFKRKK